MPTAAADDQKSYPTYIHTFVLHFPLNAQSAQIHMQSTKGVQQGDPMSLLLFCLTDPPPGIRISDFRHRGLILIIVLVSTCTHK